MNNKKVIAEIRLAPGEIGYYDEYSRIYLTNTNPNALIYAGTNCTQIKRSLKSGRLCLVRGSFNEPIEEQAVVTKKADEVKVEPPQEKEVPATADQKEEEQEIQQEELEVKVPEETPEEIPEEAVKEPEIEAEVEVKKSRKKSKKTVETEEE